MGSDLLAYSMNDDTEIIGEDDKGLQKHTMMMMGAYGDREDDKDERRGWSGYPELS